MSATNGLTYWPHHIDPSLPEETPRCADCRFAAPGSLVHHILTGCPKCHRPMSLHLIALYGRAIDPLCLSCWVEVAATGEEPRNGAGSANPSPERATAN